MQKISIDYAHRSKQSKCSQLAILFFCIIFGPSISFSQQSRQVIFDHDGGIDDLLSLILLTQMDDIELSGVCITPADCFLEDATTSTLKILKITGDDVMVAQGDVRPVNPFPTEWRAQPMVVNAFPDMLLANENRSNISPLSASDFIIDKLKESNSKVTFLITGPCANLTAALEKEPALINKIEAVIWMGGAVDVEGNVATHKHNGTAEWNAYWDPFATKTLVELGLNIKLIALDVTNNVPVGMDFLEKLAVQSEYQLSNLAAHFWATTINSIPVYEYTYFMWDVLATAFLGAPSIFTTENTELTVDTSVPNEGRTRRDPGSDHWVEIVKTVDVDAFYTYLLGMLKGS